MTPPATRPRKLSERELLDRYAESAADTGGLLREVHLGSRARLDAVRITGTATHGSGPTGALLTELPEGTEVDLIEAKKGLSEEVIGQCLGARVMFAAKYPHLRIARTVALCRAADTELVKFCAAAAIDVVTLPDQRRYEANERRSRTRLLYDDRWIGAVKPRSRGGDFLVGVDLGATSANLIRLSRGTGKVRAFCDERDLRERAGGRSVDLIEVRGRLRRGVIGRLLVHGWMLAQRHRLDVRRRQVYFHTAHPGLLEVVRSFGVQTIQARGWNK